MSDMKKRIYEKQAEKNRVEGDANKERAAAIRAIPWYAWILFCIRILNSCSITDVNNRVMRIEKALSGPRY